MEKPKHFRIFKIISIIFIIIGIVGIFVAISGFINMNGSFMLGGMMVSIGFFVGISSAIIGFMPEISKLTAKSSKYIQECNKDDLKDISSTHADIYSDAIKKTVRSVKEGLEDTIYCRYCGEEINSDSVYCPKCGKKL
ncbi:MAG: zinc ribbon domain-containing protein [Anaeroplasma sp.]